MLPLELCEMNSFYLVTAQEDYLPGRSYFERLARHLWRAIFRLIPTGKRDRSVDGA